MLAQRMEKKARHQRGNDEGKTFMLLCLSSLGIKIITNGAQTPWYDIEQGVKGEHL